MSAFGAVAAILKGFVRDRASVFFAIVFPLMFLVLFGGIFNDQRRAPQRPDRDRPVALIDDLPAGRPGRVRPDLQGDPADDRAAALAKVRKGDADVAVEMQGKTLVAHYTRPTRSRPPSRRDAAAPSWTAPTSRPPAAHRRSTSAPSGSRTPRCRRSSTSPPGCSAGRWR